MPIDEEQLDRHLLRTGPSLPGHTIQYDEGQRAWIIDQTLIACSEPEYHCLRLLLEQANRCVPFAQLAGYLPETEDTETAASERGRMRHLMSSLRGKIWMLGIDIVSLRDVGYLLLLSQEDAITYHDEQASEW